MPTVALSLALALALTLTTALTGDVVKLGGVPHRGQVGFLTLHEAYKYFEVGVHYKMPQDPVWVIYSER